MSDYDDAVRSWAAHLRDGGDTAWREWRLSAHRPAADAPDLSDAVHLGLVRRMGGGPLTDLVLGTPVPGRGRGDVPLPWKTAPGFGPAPRAPEDVAASDLLPLAVAVLARLSPALQRARRPDPLPPLRPWRTRYWVVGTPLTRSVVAERLAPGGWQTPWRSTHLVVAVPLAQALEELWIERVDRGGIVNWLSFCRQLAATDALPAELDVAGTARRLRAEGAEVAVVLGADPDEAAATAAAVTGIPLAAAAPRHPRPDVVEADLIRRLNRARRQQAGVAAARDNPQVWLSKQARSVGVPEDVQDWADRIAAQQRDQLAWADDYAVHGDPDVIVADQTRAARIDPAATLDLALERIAAAWAESRGERRADG